MQCGFHVLDISSLERGQQAAWADGQWKQAGWFRNLKSMTAVRSVVSAQEEAGGRLHARIGFTYDGAMSITCVSGA